MKRFKANNRAVACLGVPKVYDTFTTPHLIVEEYIDGIPLNDYSQLLEAGYDLEDVGKKLMLSFIKQVFKDGYFHGDLILEISWYVMVRFVSLTLALWVSWKLGCVRP